MIWSAIEWVIFSLLDTLLSATFRRCHCGHLFHLTPARAKECLRSQFKIGCRVRINPDILEFVSILDRSFFSRDDLVLKEIPKGYLHELVWVECDGGDVYPRKKCIALDFLLPVLERPLTKKELEQAKFLPSADEAREFMARR